MFLVSYLLGITRSLNSVLINDGNKKYFDDQLLRYMRDRKNDKVKYILKNEKPGDLTDSSQLTLLHYAAMYGATNLISYFVSVGCYVDAQDELGKTPLIFAVEENHELTVDALLGANADLNITDNQGKSALQLAFDSKTFRSLKIIEACLYRIAKLYRSDNAEIAKKLIESNCPLYFAMYLKNTAVSKILIDHGLPLDSRDRATGETALHVAAKLTDVENVKLLVDCGAEVNARDRMGKMPFVNFTGKIANSDRDLEILKILLDRGMLLTSLDYKGEMQISRLLRHDKKFLELVFDYDVDFMARDSADNTVLHKLSWTRSVNFKKLEGKNIDINLCNKGGETALDCAFVYDNENLVDFLLDNGAKVGYPDDTLLERLTPVEIIERDEITIRRIRNGKENPKFIMPFMRHEEGIEFVLKHRAKIFPYALEMKNNMAEIVIALVAMLEVSKTLISDNVLQIINNNEDFAKKYVIYKKELEKMKNEIVYESVTLFKLLTENKNKILRYMRNQTLVERLTDVERKFDLNSYYIDVLRKRVMKAIRIVELRAEAEIIFRKIFGIDMDVSIIITERVFEYLDERDLKNLLIVPC